MAKKRAKIRFAVGSAARPESTIWTVFSTGSYAYMTAVVLGGVIKVSLHASGIWRVAFTEESGAKVAGGDRVHRRVNRPRRFSGSWTLGPALVVPSSHGRELFSNVILSHFDAVWFTPPAEGRKRNFRLLFRDAGSPASWKRVTPAGSELVGSLDLANGETLFVVTWEDQLDSSAEGYIQQVLNEVGEGFTISGPRGDANPNASLIHFWDRDPSGIGITNLQLGPAHVIFGDEPP